MCTVDKMLIKGIRSFSPDNQNVIEFYRPLTLIVGHNGAGKTTIIECLKQACTGELPPNTRSGHSFIHDPKVAGETDVKAQIKLRIRTSTGQPVVVSRSFQLTQKKSQLQFKSLDSVLQTFNKETGEKQAVTYRCVDIDKMVPSLMGVSKAVLENVILVHQEESNWPLAEGQVLKKKFDDIFSATKYTKALEALRQLKKEKVQEVKEMRLKLDHLRTHRDSAVKLKETVQEGRAKVDKITTQIQDLEQQIQAKQQGLREVDGKLQQISALRNQSSQLDAKLELVTRQTAEMLAKLKDGDYEESTEQLEEWVAKFDQQVANGRLETQRMARDINSKKMENEAIKDQYAKECKRHGKLTAEAEAHQSNVQARDQFITSTASHLGLSAFLNLDGPWPDGRTREFKEALTGKLEDAQVAMAELKSQHHRIDEEMRVAVDSVTSQLARGTESVRVKEDLVRQNEAKMESVAAQANQLGVTQAVLTDIRDREREALAKLDAKKAEVERDSLGATLDKERKVLEELQSKIQTLRGERERVAAASESSTRLRMKKQELAQKEEQLNIMLTSKRSKLLNITGSSVLPPVSELYSSASETVKQRRHELQAKAARVRELQAAEAQTLGKLNSTKAQLNACEAQFERFQAELRAGMSRALAQPCVEDHYVDNLSKTEKNSNRLFERVSLAKSMVHVLRNYREAAESTSTCPLCQRPFRAKEKDECLTRIDSELTSLPATLASRETEMQRLQGQVAALKELQPMWLKYVDLKENQLPLLRDQVVTLQQQLAQHSSEVEVEGEVLAVMETEVADHQKMLQEVVWQLDRMNKEVVDLKNQASFMETSMMSVSAVRTVADVDNELDELEAKRTQHERARDEVVRKQTRLKDEMMALSDAYHTHREELSRALSQAQKKAELAQQLQDLNRSNDELRQQVEQLRHQQQPLVEQRDTLMSQRQAMRAEHVTKESEYEERVRELVGLCENMRAKMRPVEEYLNMNRSKELKSVTESLDNMKKRLDNNQQVIAQLEQELRVREQELAENDSLKREIQDCLDYRRQQAMRDDLSHQVEELQKRIVQVGDPVDLQHRSEQCQRDLEGLRGRQNMMRGAVTTEQQVIQRAQQDLGAAQYKEVEVRYSQQLIEMKTTEMANSDLEKYHHALERALLMFHTSKMADINKIIKELWQKTYRGQDIDYIQVKADADGLRSYNYRVVMYSGGAELEMRGRCSAGQKVLACLIIRLALAETFCLNCGILALDEPTTNLDADNSASLAEALRAVLQARGEQHNFQLIVITHDEKFANMIGTREYTDYLWRITKDENQHSLILQEEINEH